jgi:hypothetical protein
VERGLVEQARDGDREAFAALAAREAWALELLESIRFAPAP